MQKNNLFKTFSFPYLDELNNHYKNTVFSIDVIGGYIGNNSTFKITYKINNEEITKLIETKALQVAIEMKCSSVGLVKIMFIPYEANSFSFDIPSSNLNDEVQFKCYLVSKKKIKFENKDLAGFWAELKPVILPNNVIGESNEKIITVKHDKKIQSIFSFVKDSKLKDDDAPIIQYSRDRLVFALSPKLHRNLKKVQDKYEFIVIETLLVPEIAVILTKMEKDEDFYSEYCDKNWFKVILEKYEALYPGKEPNINPVDPFKAAQELFKGMLNKTYEFIRHPRRNLE